LILTYRITFVIAVKYGYSCECDSTSVNVNHECECMHERSERSEGVYWP